jgi:purine-binding chemotaxis protein CheW
MSQSPHKGQTQTLAQADQALVSYLDTLLSEIDEGDGRLVESAVKAALPQADTLEQKANKVDTPAAVADPAMAPAETPRPSVPDWAELPFQVLLFRVDGVSLAVPLFALCGILPLQEPLSQLPGQPAWTLGVQLNRDTKVVVLDTRRLLMPELDNAQKARPKQTHLLLIGEGDRGLSVDSLEGTVTLEKEDVRWRGAAGQRPWYAGIIVEKLTVLLDVNGVVEMLAA